MIDKFQRVADLALAAKTKLERSKYARRPNAQRTIRELDQLVNRAYDATAQHLMEGRVPNGKKVLEGLKGRLSQLTEKWFVFPALGLGNDLSIGAGNGAEITVDGRSVIGPMELSVTSTMDTTKGKDAGQPDKQTRGFDETDVSAYLDQYLAEDDVVPLADEEQGKDRDTGSPCECGKPGCECEG